MKRDRDRDICHQNWKVAFAVLLGFALIILTVSGHKAFPRENWQSRPLMCDPNELGDDELRTCRRWLVNVTQPNSQSTCCGEADAFEANAFAVTEDGNYVAIITKDYPSVTTDDGEGGDVMTSRGYARGDKVIIPKEKVNPAYLQGNPTGRGIVFLNGSGTVLCYFSPTLSFNVR